jgi:3-oxoacyl-[acyl-carrier protein] reductase
MSHPIHVQTVIVTGAGRGLGAAIATAFAREGARVAINYRNSAASATTLAAKLGDRCQAFQADVTDPDQVRTMVADIENTLGQSIRSSTMRWQIFGLTRTGVSRWTR